MGLHQIDSKPALTSRVERIYDVVVDMADRVVSPATRQKSWESTVAFAQENPLFFSFLTLQALLTTFPLLLFLSFSIGVLAIVTISAILFSLFWIGLALLVLLPTLFVTVSLGCFAWAIAVAWFLVTKYAVERMWGSGERQTLVRAERNGTGGKVWEGTNGTSKRGEKGVEEKVKAVVGNREDVDRIGMMEIGT